MAAKRPSPPRPRDQVVAFATNTPDSTQRAVDQLQQAAGKLSAPRSVRVVDLIVGANRINHGLGRKAQGATVAPTVADATFAWSFAPDGDRVAIITVVGVAQPGATVECF